MNQTIIYNRTSTEDQNPENQLKDCQSINKFGEATVLEDKQSAWKDNVQRPNFEIILKRIKEKKVKNLIVWDLDRLYRNRERLKEFFQICKVNGCNVYSYRQKFLNEIMDIKLPEQFAFIKEMMVNNFIEFLGWIAEEESQKKSDRVKAAVRVKDGIKVSYKGNKWGRKSFSKDTVERVLNIQKSNPEMSLRKILAHPDCYYYDKSNNKKKLSLGSVQKLIKENKQELDIKITV